MISLTWNMYCFHCFVFLIDPNKPPPKMKEASEEGDMDAKKSKGKGEEMFKDDPALPNTLRNEILWQWFEAKCILRSDSSTGKLPQSSQGCDWTRENE